MLRPATPLTVLLFASFVLLLISTISTPIIKGIPLARHDGISYGVFGWCKDDGECSPIELGWKTDSLPTLSESGVSMSPASRHSLSSLLVVHPIAAFCNLVVLALAIAAHLHSPSHSARYLLGLLILLLPTLLVTLLAFLVDILLFVAHLQWAGWIVLASTILITASGVVTCAMRRTLVSRKARKKRIAENAEMSGANFFARQAEETRMANIPSSESKTPMVNGAPGADALPSFTTVHTAHTDDLPGTAISQVEPTSANTPIDGRYYGAAAPLATPRSRSNSRPRPEDVGSAPGWTEERPPLPPPASMPPSGAIPLPPPGRGSYSGRGGYSSRGGPSYRGGPNNRGPPPGSYRGRGGYPPRGRGGFVPGTGPMGPPGTENRRPPPGYGPQGPQMAPEGYGPPPVNTSIPYQRRHSNELYSPSSNYSTEVPLALEGLVYGARAQSPARSRQSPYGSRAQSPASGHPNAGFAPPVPPISQKYDDHDNRLQRRATGATAMTADSDVLGTMERQRIRPNMQRQGSSDEYVPPRSSWSANQPLGPVSPVGSSHRKRINSSSSDYLEDVDPRFAEPLPSLPHSTHNGSQNRIPSLLVAGSNSNDPSPESSSSQINNKLPRSSSYDDLAPGARSPVESEISTFTSVSQRPINKNWQPGNGGEFNSFGPATRPRSQQRRQDMLFNGNPDFELPGSGPVRGRGGPPRGRGGYGRPPTARNQPIVDSVGSDSRYPIAPNGTGGSMKEI